MWTYGTVQQQHGCIGDFIVTGPLVLGHESSGIVTQVGGEVRGLAIGSGLSSFSAPTLWLMMRLKATVWPLNPEFLAGLVLTVLKAATTSAQI